MIDEKYRVFDVVFLVGFQQELSANASVVVGNNRICRDLFESGYFEAATGTVNVARKSVVEEFSGCLVMYPQAEVNCCRWWKQRVSI